MATITALIIVVIRPYLIPVALSFNALLVSGINTWNERKYLKIKQMAIPMMTRIPGSLAGGWLLIHLNIVWL